MLEVEALVKFQESLPDGFPRYVEYWDTATWWADSDEDYTYGDVRIKRPLNERPLHGTIQHSTQNKSFILLKIMFEEEGYIQDVILSKRRKTTYKGDFI